MTIVTESEVITAVLFSRITSSLYQGLLALIAAVTVTPPLPLSAFTVRLIGVVRVRPPPVPVTVIVAAPSAAALDAERVSTPLPPVVDAGLKFANTPLGNPLALKATLPVKPPVLVMAIVLVPLDPRLMARPGGLADREKSGVGTSFTVRPRAMLRV